MPAAGRCGGAAEGAGHRGVDAAAEARCVGAADGTAAGGDSTGRRGRARHRHRARRAAPAQLGRRRGYVRWSRRGSGRESGGCSRRAGVQGYGGARAPGRRCAASGVHPRMCSGTCGSSIHTHLACLMITGRTPVTFKHRSPTVWCVPTTRSNTGGFTACDHDSPRRLHEETPHPNCTLCTRADRGPRHSHRSVTLHPACRPARSVSCESVLFSSTRGGVHHEAHDRGPAELPWSADAAEAKVWSDQGVRFVRWGLVRTHVVEVTTQARSPGSVWAGPQTLRRVLRRWQLPPASSDEDASCCCGTVRVQGASGRTSAPGNRLHRPVTPPCCVGMHVPAAAQGPAGSPRFWTGSGCSRGARRTRTPHPVGA